MWERLGLALLHFVWQGLVVAAIVSIVAACLPRGRQRYAAYLAGMAVMLACLPATFLVFRLTPPIAEGTWRNGAVAAQIAAPVVEQPEEAAAIAIPMVAAPAKQWISPRELLVSAVWVWLMGASLLSARLPLAWLAIRQLRARATPVDDDLRARVDALSRTLGLRRAVAAMASSRVLQPVVMGCLRPVILLPISILSEMPVAMLEAVIAHELAHVRRRDLWVVYGQRLAETVLFYHPAVWWISSRISTEREICCDEVAVAATGRRVEYATALEGVARSALFATSPAPSTALAFGAPRQPTLERVRHVLGLSPARPAWGWASGFGAIVVIATLFAVGCGLARSRNADELAQPKSSAALGAATRAADARPRVLLVSDGDFFLERALAAIEWAQLTIVAPARYDAEAAAGYDVVMFDEWLPPGNLPHVNSLFWAVVPRDVARGEVVHVNGPFEAKLPEHPLVRGLSLTPIVVRDVRAVTPPADAEVVVASGEVPLVFTYRADSRHTRIVAPFDHEESNWPLQTSFPVFVHNALELLTSRQRAATSPSLPPTLNAAERQLIGRWEPASDFDIPGIWSFSENGRFELIVSGRAFEAGTWKIRGGRNLLLVVDQTADAKRAGLESALEVEQLDQDALVFRVARHEQEPLRRRYRRAAPASAPPRVPQSRASAATTQPASVQRSVPLIFRPTTTNSGKTSWSGPIPNRAAGPRAAFMLVNAHRGDRWPVRVRHDAPPICYVKVVDGDARQLEVELDDGLVPRRVTVKLNQSEKLDVAGREITIGYGESSSAGEAPQYVDYATLTVSFKDEDGDEPTYHFPLKRAGGGPTTTHRSSGTSRRTMPMTTTTPTTSSKNP